MATTVQTGTSERKQDYEENEKITDSHPQIGRDARICVWGPDMDILK